MLGQIPFFFISLLPFLYAVESFSVVGIGSPRMHTIQQVDESFLQTISLEKEEHKRCDGCSFQTIKALLTTHGDRPCLREGGPTCNILKALATLGVRTAVIGAVGNDSLGKDLLKKLTDSQVSTFIKEVEAATSQVLCFITPDGKKTFYSYHPAELLLEPTDLNLELFNGVQIVHVEDYRLMHDYYIERAMYLAKSKGALVSFHLSNPTYADRYRERILALLTNYVDVLFTTQHEAFILTHLQPKQAADYLTHFCQTVVLNLDSHDRLINSSQGNFYLPSPGDTHIATADSNDLFAAGFLYGLLQKKDLANCAKIGLALSCRSVDSPQAKTPAYYLPYFPLYIDGISQE